MAKEEKVEVKVSEMDGSRKLLIAVNDVDKALFYVNGSTFANCQVFTIGCIYYITYLESKEAVKKTLQSALQYGGMKRLCVLDIKEDCLKDVIKELTPYLEKVVYDQPYTSTNGSNMHTVMVQFDLEKLK